MRRSLLPLLPTEATVGAWALHDSLQIGAWTTLVFATAALRRSFFAHNILADL